jgi:hypothetical protein
MQTVAATAAQNESPFPGYPHYPQSEDVMSTAKRTELDLEKFPERAPVGKTSEQPAIPEATTQTPRTESELTKDDLAALGAKDEDMDEGDDEIMSLSGERYDRTGEDLDVPGAELDDENENIGTEDEENNYYSLGGDKEENSS